MLITRDPGGGHTALEILASRALDSLEELPSLASFNPDLKLPSSFELTFFGRTAVKGVPAYEARYSRSWAQLDRPDDVSISLYIVSGSDYYQITATAPRERWIEREALLRDTVYSFLPLTVPLPTATPAPRVFASLSPSDVENLVYDAMLPCLLNLKEILDFAEKNKRWNTRYLDRGEWLVEVMYWGLKLDNKNNLINLGRWRVIERTGEIIPFDGTARSYSDCIR